MSLGKVNSHGNNSSSIASTSSSTERKSADFSISAILSDDTGSSSQRVKVTPVRGRECQTSSGVLISPPGQSIPMSTPSRYTSHFHSSPHLTSRFTPTTATPTSHWASTGALNQSLSSSPFNISLLLLASSPTASEVANSQNRLGLESGKGDRFLCNDSLGVLSTVALYHSELSDSGEEGGEREKEGSGKQRERTGSVTNVGDGMAQMRLESSCDTADTTLSVEDRCSTPPPPSPTSPSSLTRAREKGTTPFILKRDRKRRRQLCGSFAPHTSSAEVTKNTNPHRTLQSSHPHTEHRALLDTGFLSPTSAQTSPHHTNLSFSPSIFLSRPANSMSTDRSLSMDTSLPHSATECAKDVSVTHESDRTREATGTVSVKEGCEKSSVDGGPSTAQASSFTTSTPIKQDKENARTSGFHLSPTYLSPSESSKRPRLRETTVYEASSGSDSEVPVKKCRSRSHALHRRSKARAQLSPLLENACSPIAKADHRPPSSLLTANFPASTTSTYIPPGAKEPLTKISVQEPHHPFPITPITPQPPISVPCLPPQVPFPISYSTLPPQFPAQLSRPPNLCLGMMPVAPNPLFPISVSPLSPPQGSYFIPPRPPVVSPTTASLLHPNSFYYYNAPHTYNYPTSTTAAAAATAAGNVSQKWSGSPLSAQWEKTGQIQSVPPWFIFEQNRPEGKRLRLTEAINRSLSETPSHNPKLPAEWTKYACGQTDDQRLLTQKARLFLQSGRRQLTFDNINT